MSLHDNITEIRALLRDIEPLPKPAVTPAANDSEKRLQRAYDWFDVNAPGPVIELTQRAEDLRRIRVIQAWRPWGELVILRALEKARVARMEDLTDDQVGALRARIEDAELAAQTGCDADDDCPAR
jgi:hypothetical protein